MNTLPPIVTLNFTKSNLQTITGSDISFTAATKTIADAHAVFNVFSVGTKFTVSGAGDAGNKTTFTVATIGADYKSVTVDETVTDDAAGDAITINEQYYGDWVYCGDRSKLVGSINSSQNCTVYIDQSNDANNTDYTTTVAVTGGTAAAWEISVLYAYARMRILNGGTDQTSLRASLNGRTVT